ncbi:hypothetical protein AB8B23_04845 [Leptotrichia sp. HSP-342]|uniref:Lipoprotein n=1 Tax=Leptotrichia mesophila TaxID=3239303 RepID=A0AB39VER6_9FUSO
MKKIILLLTLLILISSCTAFEIANQMEKERGRECRYNYKGEVQNCGYIN